MKALPNRGMEEIYKEFHAIHGGKTIEQIREGRQDQETVWTLAKLVEVMAKEGWGNAAIGRFTNRSSWSILYHNKGIKKYAKNDSKLTGA